MVWYAHSGPAVPERLAAITALLEEGLSRSEIANRLHITKNMVVGLINRHIKHIAKRKDGEPRQQPRCGPQDPGRCEAVRVLLAQGVPRGEIAARLGITRNAVDNLVRRHIRPKRTAPPPVESTPAPPRASAPEPPPRAPPASLPAAWSQPKACQWPLRVRPWRFCEAAPVLGRPYCERHCRRAYLQRRVAA